MKKVSIGSFEFNDYEDENQAQLETWLIETIDRSGMVVTGDKIVTSSESLTFASLVGLDIRTLPPLTRLVGLGKLNP